jgi:hypothetical protein
MLVFWDVSDVLTASIIRAISTSETSVNFYQTARCNIPEYSHFHTRRRENLKSHNQLGSQRMRWEDNIKTDLRDIRGEDQIE